jgi:hypothetical protein
MKFGKALFSDSSLKTKLISNGTHQVLTGFSQTLEAEITQSLPAVWARRHVFQGVLLEFLQFIDVLIDTLSARILLVLNFTFYLNVSLLQVD